MPFLCADSGPWSKMSRAWGAAEARQERVFVEVLRKAIVAGQCFVFVEHIYKYFLSVLF